MAYIIRLNTDGTTEIIKMPAFLDDMEWFADKIGCEWVERVRPRYYNHTLLVDEEGLLKQHPKLNVLASKMYGTFEHCQPIVGNALLIKESGYPPEFVGFSYDEAKSLKDQMDSIYPSIINSKDYKAFLAYAYLEG